MRYLKSAMLAIMISAVSCLLIMATGNIAMAAVSGVCSNCHTMHDSQNNANMGAVGIFDALLLNNCIGCHTTTGGDPLDNGNTPYVQGSGFTNDNCLAGGFFSTGGGNHNDNSHTLGATVSPAGYDPNGPAGNWYQGNTVGFTCAGATGCHGNQSTVDNDMEAIKGGHHNTSSTYRMLYVQGTTLEPVDGTGAADYEEELINTVTIATSTSDPNIPHNIYSAGDSDVTISELCGKCHGRFHSDTGAPSPFTRHPTDIDIPTDWEIVNTSGYPDTDYSDADRKYNPLGFAGGTAENVRARATCLSCHRAHGSAVNDILRFAYNTQQAGSTTNYGCLGCHSKQRQQP